MNPINEALKQQETCNPYACESLDNMFVSMENLRKQNSVLTNKMANIKSILSDNNDRNILYYAIADQEEEIEHLKQTILRLEAQIKELKKKGKK